MHNMRPRTVKAFTTTVVLLLVAVFLISCSQASNPTTSTREKIVRIDQSWPCYIDPAVGMDNAADIATVNLYDTLVKIGDDGTAQPEATKNWDFDQATNTYTFHLNTGIQFHAGGELTASDVVFSLNRMLTIGQGWSYLFKRTVASSKAVDAQTVQITLKQPYGPFLLIMPYMCILSEKVVMANIKAGGQYGKFGDYATDWLVTHDAGSGPYMVKEMKTAESLTCVRFPGYWQGWDPAAPDTFEELATNEPVTVRTLMSQQQLEISDEWQPAENYTAMSKISGVEVAQFLAGAVLNLSFNTSRAPLDDVHFRRALVYSFDYATCRTLFPGSGVTNGPVGSGLAGSDSSSPTMEQDLAKAKAELKLSKYGSDPSKYPVEFDWIAEVPDEEKVALLMQSNCAGIGIKMNVVKMPWLTATSNTAKASTSPMIFTEIKTSIAYPEAGALLENGYSSAGIGTYSNPHWFTPAIQSDLDKKIAAAMETMDTAARYEKYKILTDTIVNLATDVTCCEAAQRHAYQAGYLDWPEADRAKAGEKPNVMPGYRMYFRDFRFIAGK
jgi:peptide/nickel transport system substrate-binding protein